MASIKLITTKLKAALQKFGINDCQIKFSSLNTTDLSDTISRGGSSRISFSSEMDEKRSFVFEALNKLWPTSSENNSLLFICSESNLDFLENLPEDFFESLYADTQAIEHFSGPGMRVHPQQLSELGEENAHFAPPQGATIEGYAQSTVGNLYQQDPENPSEKTAIDDVGGAIYIDGLPTIFIADGAFGTNPAFGDYICHQFLPSILPQYVSRLTKGEDASIVMQDLLVAVNQEAFNKKEAYNIDGYDQSRTTFSCAISYKDSTDSRLKVASIGVGSDMLMIYRNGHYIPLRPAENLTQGNPVFNDGTRVAGEYDYSHIDSILSGKSACPNLKCFLPVDPTRLQVELSPKVYVQDLQEQDQLVGLSDGAFEFLPQQRTSRNFSGKENETGRIIERSLEADAPSPENLFSKNQQRHPKEARKGDDAILLTAKVPSQMQQEKIRAASTFEGYKKEVITILEKNYPWRPALFGHHHHERLVAVCQAIRGAQSPLDVAVILKNQCDRLDSNSHSPTPIHSNLLEARWGLTIKNKPLVGQTSGYQNAIELARTVTMPPSLRG